jgi:hypothetical protein
MNFADLINIPTLVGSALGATIFGWVGAYVAVKGKNFATRQDVVLLRQDLLENTHITKSVDQKFARSDVVWRGDLDFRQRQLAELYGPIYAYVKSQQDIYKSWMAGAMAEKNHEIKRLFSAQNKSIRNLIIEKAHLIEGSAMPDSFVRFFTSTLIFDLYAAGTDDGQVPQHLRDDPRCAYPLDFNDHIVRVTEALKARTQGLNAQYAAPLGLMTETITGGDNLR